MLRGSPHPRSRTLAGSSGVSVSVKSTAEVSPMGWKKMDPGQNTETTIPSLWVVGKWQARPPPHFHSSRMPHVGGNLLPANLSEERAHRASPGDRSHGTSSSTDLLFVGPIVRRACHDPLTAQTTVFHPVCRRTRVFVAAVILCPSQPRNIPTIVRGMLIAFVH